jgi:glycosyltransferase involved in cell wall biosynthesis
LRESELFTNLNIFFRLFKNNTTAGDIKEQFLFCLKGMNSRKDIFDKLDSIKAVYETALMLLEKDAADKGFDEGLLSLQRDLYIELEYVLSFEHGDKRHHFLVVIPVADRPVMLGKCLESLVEQCRIFQYGGFTIDAHGTAVYNKISVFIIDDSKDEDNILKIKKICSETAAAGIKTYYIGLDEQAELLDNIPSQYREKLRELLGEFGNRLPPHKGASISRNIAYLWLHAFLAEFRQKSLIYFLDDDEEFRIKIKRKTSPEDIQFINYFYWLDKIFSTSDVEVVTGKVVGDPPVSSSVMINTFLDDIALFFKTLSSAAPDEKCMFHDNQAARASSAEYHDMVKLFGYSSSVQPREYLCSLSGDHTVRDCLDDFSKKALGFFYGLHPTRTQLYIHGNAFTETEKARTVYTGNYVSRTAGLRHFIPFASLKLRMAGPALGRILRKRLNHEFVSANLPLLHKRTSQSDYSNEFRSGVSENMNSIDLSGEFNRQFWGDVMLFSIERLAEIGYPDARLGLSVITGITYDIQAKLWNLYKERQTEIVAKSARIARCISQKKFWWNKEPEAQCAVKNMRLFCSVVENNFGAESSGMNKISKQIKEGTHITMIINAIHSFHESEISWNDLLKSEIAAPSNCGGDCSTILKR